MLKDFIIKSKFYLMLIFVLFLLFSYVAIYHMDFIMNIDLSINKFISNYVVNDKLNILFKLITNMGGVLFFLIFLVVMLLVIKDKKYFSYMSINLLITYLFSVIFKNIFRRERPLYSIIEKPSDYSFPSGHTMCSAAFYGLLIYFVKEHVKNKFLKWILYILLSLIILLVAFSRIYLQVHHFSDVIGGFILGLVCLLMFINYVRINK